MRSNCPLDRGVTRRLPGDAVQQPRVAALAQRRARVDEAAASEQCGRCRPGLGLAGAAIGAVVISGLSEGLREIEKASDQKNITEVVLALILLAILILRPKGITGNREFRWPPFGRSRRHDAPAGG